MSCLEARLTLLGSRVVAGAELVNRPLSVETTLPNCGMRVACGLVCDVGGLKHLNVSPEDVQWITPDEGVLYSVESNTNWIVEF